MSVHISTFRSDWTCPHCSFEHEAKDWEDRVREARKGWYVPCKGCKRTVRLFFTITGDVVVLSRPNQ